MDVSVCIVNWNTRELLRACLASIEACTHGAEVEVIVVDNASGDGSAGMVRTQFPRVLLTASSENVGFARGSNIAARAAAGDFILFLNPDTELASDAISGLWRFLRGHPGHGAAGCRLLNTDGSIQATCAGAMPSMRNELSSMLGLDRLFPRSPMFAAREMNYWDHADSRDVDCLSGACLMLPRALAQELGSFDDSLFMYGEDLDLCCRVRARGLRLRYVAEETIYHHEGSASRVRGRNFAFVRQRGANYYVLRKNRGLFAALGYRAAVALGSAARLSGGLAAAPFWHRRPDGPAIGDFLRRNGELLLWSLGLAKVPAA